MDFTQRRRVKRKAQSTIETLQGYRFATASGSLRATIQPAATRQRIPRAFDYDDYHVSLHFGFVGNQRVTRHSGSSADLFRAASLTTTKPAARQESGRVS